ncbi:hypothetical protein Tco_0060194 [Tanacetum coccineum]
MKLSMKKLEILKKNIKFMGGLLGLKDFLMILELLLLRSDFESWQQCIRLYCKGKDNKENILQLIDEESLKTLHWKKRKADIRATNILLQGLPNDIYTLINHYTNAKDIWDNVKMLLEGSELTKDERKSQLYDEFEHFCQNKGEPLHECDVRFTKLINDMRNIKMNMPKMQLNSKFVNNMLPEWDRFVTTVKLNRGLKTSNYDMLYAYLKQHEAHANENKMMVDRTEENRVVLDEEQLLFIGGGQANMFDDDVDEAHVQDLSLNEDHVFQADQCDAFDFDVDEAPTGQTMFMANLSSADPIYDKAGPSYDSDIVFEVQDHDNYLDSVDEYQEVHKMHNDGQQNYVVNSDAEYTSDGNIIPYDQYVKNNTEQVLQIVNESLTAELARYKEQVKIYEKRARFELTEREQKIDEQMRIIITDRNIKEKSLKKELHSVKMQLNSTIDHNKLMKEEVATLKKDFKQKENKYLEEFLDMKAVKEKVEDKLFKQDQSLQTVHMLCKPKPFYDEKKNVAIGYINPLYLTSAMQVQSALYNGHEIVKTNHAPAVVNDSEDTFELAEITRKKMLEKMKSPLCVENKVKIAPPDYSNENYLATFTPQRQLST